MEVVTTEDTGGGSCCAGCGCLLLLILFLSLGAIGAGFSTLTRTYTI